MNSASSSIPYPSAGAFCLGPISNSILDAVKTFLKRSLDFFTILPAFSVHKEVESREFSQYTIDDPDMLRTISIVTPARPRNHAVTTYLQRHIEERASAIKARLATVF